jgi:hypothetical protein
MLRKDACMKRCIRIFLLIYSTKDRQAYIKNLKPPHNTFRSDNGEKIMSTGPCAWKITKTLHQLGTRNYIAYPKIPSR